MLLQENTLRYLVEPFLNAVIQSSEMFYDPAPEVVFPGNGDLLLPLFNDSVIC